LNVVIAAIVLLVSYHGNLLITNSTVIELKSKSAAPYT